mgnify:CR=1 FL=1
MNKNNSTWIAGIARGHNAGVCLLKDGEVVFSIEEERLSRTKYDGGPLASIVKILEYTDKTSRNHKHSLGQFFTPNTLTKYLLSTLPKMDKCAPDGPEFQDLKRRVSFIDAPHARLQPECPQRPHPANPQNHFLFEQIFEEQ